MTALREIDGVTLQSNRLIALRQIALRAVSEPVLAALPGGFTTRRKGHGQEVADVREYISGDDIRHLDRGATAKTGRLHVRQFEEERDRVTLLVADFRPSMFWGITRAFRSVAVAEVLALIGWRIVEDGGRVGLCTFGHDTPMIVPSRGRVRGMLDVIGGLVQGHHQALNDLMGNSEARDIPLDQCLTNLHRICPPGSEIVLASGFDVPGDTLGDQLDDLARRRTPRLVLVSDADASGLPRGDYPIRLADGRRVKVTLASAEDTETVEIADIEGFPGLHVDAGQSAEHTARKIAAAFPARDGVK